jgi:hypothetical protein
MLYSENKTHLHELSLVDHSSDTVKFPVVHTEIRDQVNIEQKGIKCNIVSYMHQI